MQTQLAHYRACKQLRSDTSSCLLLPTYLARRASRHLSGMSLLRRFDKGTVLFNGLDLAGALIALPALAYSVDVWYDAPGSNVTVTAPFLSALCPPVAASLSGDDLPRVNLSVANTTLLTLVDSGASHDFVSESTIRQLGLTLRPCDWSHVTLADGGKRALLGQVTLRASAGPLRLQLHPYVLPDLTNVASLILGSASLRQFGASLDYGSRTLRLCKATLSYRLPLLDTAVRGGAAPVASAAPHINFALSAMCSRSVPELIAWA